MGSDPIYLLAPPILALIFANFFARFFSRASCFLFLCFFRLDANILEWLIGASPSLTC